MARAPKAGKKAGEMAAKQTGQKMMKTGHKMMRTGQKKRRG